MKIKKKYLTSLFGSKNTFKLLYKNEEELIKIISILIPNFLKESIYIEVNKFDYDTIDLFKDSIFNDRIDLGNHYLIKLNNTDFLKGIDSKNINNLRFLNIYSLVNDLVKDNNISIRKQLYNSSFTFSLDNYLEVCEFSINYNDYNSEITDKIFDMFI